MEIAHGLMITAVLCIVNKTFLSINRDFLFKMVLDVISRLAKTMLLVIYIVVISFMIIKDINVKIKISIIVRENNVQIIRLVKLVQIIVKSMNCNVLIFRKLIVNYYRKLIVIIKIASLKIKPANNYNVVTF